MTGPAACLNCGTALAGRWCHACGQDAHHDHRSLRGLAEETIEGLFHADSRLWRTLAQLALRPAVLTRSYIAGQRASQIPPLRLFLVALLALFLTRPPSGIHLDIAADPAPGTAQHETPAKAAPADHIDVDIPGYPALAQWIARAAPLAAHHPDEVLLGMREWAHRLAILLLPIAALTLKLLYAGRRAIALFDHLIFATHSLSFLGFTTALLLSLHAPGWLMLGLPACHLFAHLRGTYGGSILATGLRMGALGALSALVFLAFLLGLAGLSVNEMMG